jgi:hypothetical protein
MTDELAKEIVNIEMTKDNKIWEAKLVRHIITNDYKIIRKYGHSKKIEDLDSEWDFKAKNKFIWKVKQKLLNGYKVKNIHQLEKILDFLDKKGPPY